MKRCECGALYVYGQEKCLECGKVYEKVEVCHVRKPVEVVPHGWGKETWIVNDKYCGKVLEFEQGKGFSDHFHVKKTETFYVLKGFAELMIRERDGKEYNYTLSKGAIVDITPGLMHRIKATSYFVMIEFSDHHDEADSYRIKKGD